MLSRLVIFFSAVEYSFEKDYVVGKRKKKTYYRQKLK